MQRTALYLIAALIAAAPVAALGGRADNGGGPCGDSKADFCEIRELTLAGGELAVDATPNGGISVESWDRDEIRIRAKVTARARGDEDRAAAIAQDVRIATKGVVKATGPKHRSGMSWSVSYAIKVPRQTDMDLDALNGGIDARGVSGRMRITTTNGGIHLAALAGDVRARTTNGGISVALDGERWSGAGLDVKSTNGGINLKMSEDYSADLSLGTTNGGIHLGFPVAVSGRIGKRVDTTIGAGGAPISAVTVNGGIQVGR